MKSKLPEGWKEVTLNEVGKIITGKTPSTKKRENFNGNIPFLTPSDNMDNRFVVNTERTLSKEGLKLVKGQLIPENSICVSCIGSQLGKVIITKEKTVTNQQINSIIVDEAIDDMFVYYALLLVGKRLKYISKTSTAIPIINKTNFSKEKIVLPHIKEQKAIAATLSALDDKIELNNKINENLEQQAQAIFKHWFIDFEFPDENGKPYRSSGGEMIESELGMIPKGWEVGSIKDYAEVKSGYAFKSSWWRNEGFRVLKITNISSGKLILDNCSYVDEDKIPKDKRYIAYSSDLLIALTGATLGMMAIIPKLEETLLVNQRVGKFIYSEEFDYPLPFLYCLLSTENIISEIIDRGQGSAQPNISPTSLGSIKFIYPQKEVINKFNNNSKPFFERCIYVYNQNQKLSQLRDTLLPKLMSGQIRIPLDEEQGGMT